MNKIKRIAKSLFTSQRMKMRAHAGLRHRRDLRPECGWRLYSRYECPLHRHGGDCQVCALRRQALLRHRWCGGRRGCHQRVHRYDKRGRFRLPKMR